MRRFEELNHAVHRAESQAGADSGRVPAAARSADRPHLPGGAVDGRPRRCCAAASRIGSFVMFNTYMGMLVWPMIALGWVVNLMQRGTRLARAASTRSCAEQPSIAAPPHPVAAAEPCAGEIEFRGVAMDYRQRRARWTASTCAFRRAPPSPWWATPGSGKSTLVEPGAAPDGSHRRRGAARRHRPARTRSRPSCAGTSASCRRRRSCSAPPSPRTSPSAWRAPPRTRSAAPPKSPGLAGDIEGFPDGLPDHGGRARHHALGRPEAAHRHRPRHPARSAHSDSRRCAFERRYPHRRAHPHATWRA